MGLFDKLRSGEAEEEVELKPPSEQRSQQRLRHPEHISENRRDQQQRDTVELRDEAAEQGNADNDDSDEFLLPGMKPQNDASSGSSNDSTTAASGRSASTELDAGEAEKLGKIMEQNERIIELLEEIAGDGSSNLDADIW